jgi:hypothetical protein
MATRLSTTIANVVAGATGPTGPTGATGATGPGSINILNRSTTIVNVVLNTNSNLPILNRTGSTIYVTAS